MTGKGQIAHQPAQRIRRLAALHAIWLVFLLALVGWWGWLALRQADRIHELELKLGLTSDQVEREFARTQRMLISEGATFMGLVLVAGGALIVLVWRDGKRQRSLQAFFASVTHELRTPLTSIRLQAESLTDLMGPRPHEDELTLVKRLLEDVQRLENQVERTLELSRVEGGGPVHLESIPLQAWIDRSLGNWLSTYGSRIELRNEVARDAWVEADATALQVIFRNLIENSLRHSRQEPVRIRIATGSGTSPATLEVRYEDDGVGYAGVPARLGEIFEKGAASQGAGVGLYLVRVLMERMNGRARFVGGSGFPVALSFRRASGEGS